MTDYAIEVSGLGKTYRGFALKDVTFSLPRGYVMGLVGPNGAGKTTIIKLLMNLIRRDGGEIRMFGQDARAREAQVKARIGFVYDEPRFYEDVSLDDMRRVIAPFYADWNEPLFRQLAAEFELPLRKKIKTLSMGMRTKFALALALAHDAELLILDEPTAGLDPVFRRELLLRLSALRQDGRRSILFSTHITTDLEQIADYIVFVRGGRVALVATRDELLEQWGIVRGDARTVAGLDPALRRGVRQHAHGVDVLTPDLGAARRLLGDAAVVDRVSLDDIVVMLDREDHHA